VYGIHKGGRWGGRILRSCRAIVLQHDRLCRLGGQYEDGGLPQSSFEAKRYIVKANPPTACLLGAARLRWVKVRVMVRVPRLEVRVKSETLTLN